MSLNHIDLMGRLVRDPEVKTTQSGVAVCNFTIAVDRDYKNGDERVADFVDCVAWRGTAEFVQKYFSKGRMAVVSGSLQSRKWEDKDGNKRTSWEVQVQNVYFGDSKRDGDSGGSSSQSNDGYGPQEPQQFTEVEDDGELPF